MSKRDALVMMDYRILGDLEDLPKNMQTAQQE